MPVLWAHGQPRRHFSDQRPLLATFAPQTRCWCGRPPRCRRSRRTVPALPPRCSCGGRCHSVLPLAWPSTVCWPSSPPGKQKQRLSEAFRPKRKRHKKETQGTLRRVVAAVNGLRAHGRPRRGLGAAGPPRVSPVARRFPARAFGLQPPGLLPSLSVQFLVWQRRQHTVGQREQQDSGDFSGKKERHKTLRRVVAAVAGMDQSPPLLARQPRRSPGPFCFLCRSLWPPGGIEQPEQLPHKPKQRRLCLTCVCGCSSRST